MISKLKKLFFHYNRNINRLNVHLALFEAAGFSFYLFDAVYFYTLGVPVWLICLIWITGFHLLKIVFRKIALDFCIKFGLKKSVLIGLGLFALETIPLFLTKGFDFWIFTYMFLMAFSGIFYWLAIQTYFSQLGESKNRGKELGQKHFFTGIVSIAAPLLSGAVVLVLGFKVLFIFLLLFVVLSIIPLLWLPDLKISEPFSWKKCFRDISPAGAILSAGSAVYETSSAFLWVLVMFIFFNNAISFGGINSLAAAISLFVYYAMGALIDIGRGKNFVFFGAALIVIAIILRSFLPLSFYLIVILDVLLVLSFSVFNPYSSTVFYNTSLRQKNPLWYQFYAETGYDIGAIFASIIAAAIIYFTKDVRLGMLIGILGVILELVAIHLVSKKILSDKNKKTPAENRQAPIFPGEF